MIRTRARSTKNRVAIAAGPMRLAGLANLNQSPFMVRKQAVLADGFEPPEGHVVCTECYRVVRIRLSDGKPHAHKSCPGAPPTGCTL